MAILGCVATAQSLSSVRTRDELSSTRRQRSARPARGAQAKVRQQRRHLIGDRTRGRAARTRDGGIRLPGVARVNPT